MNNIVYQANERLIRRILHKLPLTLKGDYKSWRKKFAVEVWASNKVGKVDKSSIPKCSGK